MGRYLVFFLMLALPWFSLSRIVDFDVLSLSDKDKLELIIKHKLINDISMDELKVSSVNIERIYDSEIFSVSVDGKHYIVTGDAKYWVSAAYSDVFKINGNVENVNINNKDREDMLLLIGLIARQDGIVTISPEVSEFKKSVFAFIDISCPHCRDFHLKVLQDWNRRGVRIYLVPFMRNPEDKKVASVMNDIFCAEKNSERLDLILNAYINVKTYKTQGNSASCGYRKPMLESLYRIGSQYKLKGSPMFVNMVGDVYYGVDAYVVAEIKKEVL
jgi:hypothetical protein